MRNKNKNIKKRKFTGEPARSPTCSEWAWKPHFEVKAWEDRTVHWLDFCPHSAAKNTKKSEKKLI